MKYPLLPFSQMLNTSKQINWRERSKMRESGGSSSQYKYTFSELSATITKRAIWNTIIDKKKIQLPVLNFV